MKRVTAPISEEISLKRLLLLLRDLTARIRTVAILGHEDRLFLYVSKNGGAKIGDYGESSEERFRFAMLLGCYFRLGQFADISSTIEIPKMRIVCARYGYWTVGSNKRLVRRVEQIIDEFAESIWFKSSLDFVNDDICFNYGVALSELGRVEESLAPLNKCLRLDPSYDTRQRGSGPLADIIAQRFRSAVRRLGLDAPTVPLDVSAFRPPPKPGSATPQMSLF